MIENARANVRYYPRHKDDKTPFLCQILTGDGQTYNAEAESAHKALLLAARYWAELEDARAQKAKNAERASE